MGIPNWLWPSVRKTPQQREWEEHLTPEFRQYFDSVGEDFVKRDLDAYQQPGKNPAAKAWLLEKRQKREVRDARLFRLVVLSIIFSAIGVYIGWANS